VKKESEKICLDKLSRQDWKKEIDMVNTKTLEKHIVGENGISYTLGADEVGKAYE
jgi:hypothetical protein